jgi:hypothetical protein
MEYGESLRTFSREILCNLNCLIKCYFHDAGTFSFVFAV